MNKLRVAARTCGAAVLLLTAWATLRYGLGVGQFVPYLALGGAVVVLPEAATRVKHAHRRLRSRRRAGGDHPSFGTVYVSEEPVTDREGTLSAIAAAARDAGAFDDVSRDESADGPGLTIAHTGFHDSLVRFAPDGRVVVTGAATRRNERVARCIETARSVAMRRSADNPLWRHVPVRGAPRLLLGLLVIALAVAGGLGVAGAAYPSDAYNPVERSVLVSIDARATVDPGYSATDAKLAKAAFLVDVVEEKRVEMRWELNDTRAIRNHARDARFVAGETRDLLATVRAGPASPDHLARADRIERRLTEAEREAMLTARRQLEREGEPTNMLAAAANRTGVPTGTPTPTPTPTPGS